MRPEDASFFDRDADVSVLLRRLPHWDQQSTFAFITFRLSDSLPVDLLDQLRFERSQILSTFGIACEANEIGQHMRNLSPRDASILKWRLFQVWDGLLNKGLGRCVLQQPSISRVVADGIMKFDQQRYIVSAFVVMPNHVHILAAFEKPGMIAKQGSDWRRFFAKEINQILGRTGHLWQQDQFDHLVRSEASFDNIRKYIIDNPAQAKLRSGDYRLYVSPAF